MNSINDWRSVQCAKPECPKCKGSGVYNSTPIGTAHWTPCYLCCPHDQGYWLLPDGYMSAGMYCCHAGCGDVHDQVPTNSFEVIL